MATPGTKARDKKFVFAFHDLRETQHMVTSRADEGPMTCDSLLLFGHWQMEQMDYDDLLIHDLSVKNGDVLSL